MADRASIPGQPAALPQLVGREREQAALREALDRALAGHGALVLIGGEAGLGKTTLAEAALADAAAQGMLALVGRAYDLSETPPYGPWAEALARAPRDGELPTLPTAVLPAEAGGEALVSQDAVFRRVWDALATLAGRRPLAVLLDDLHWADPASLDLLRFLARGLADVPILLLATYRADEVTRGHPLATLLPLLVREARAARLDLRPLDEGGLRALVRARYALPPGDEGRLVLSLADQSEGNPFYAGELLRAVEESGTLARGDGGWRLGGLATVGVPTLLRQVIDARVDRLGEGARGLLTAAAVIGQAVPLDLWAAVAEVGEDALLDVAERAGAARLLAETETGVRFAHALIREALYAGMSPLRRRTWHRRAGEALIARPSPDPDTVAHHFRAAGDRRAVGWLVRAGERAQRAFAWLTAADRYETALALLEAQGDDTRERAWLSYRLARLYRMSVPERGLRFMEEAAAAATICADRALAAWITFDRGQLHCHHGDIRAGLADMAAGIAAFDALSDADRATIDADRAIWLADILPPATPATPPVLTMRPGVYALWLAAVGRFEEALAAGTESEAAAAASGPGDPLLLSAPADAAFALGNVHAALGRPGEARGALLSARQQFRALGHTVPAGSVAVVEVDWAVLPYQADQPAVWRALMAEAEGLLTPASGVHGDSQVQQPQVPRLLLEGRWAEARAVALDTLGPFVKPWLARLALAQGDVALARRLIGEELPEGPATTPGNTALLPALVLQRVAAALALHAGDLPTARAWLDANDRWLDWAGAVLGRADAALGRAAYHRAAGDLGAARTQAETALAHASEPRQPFALLAAHRLLGELATTDARRTDAQAHLAAALALADACANPYERALTLLALTDLHLNEARPNEATAALEEARALLAPLGAAPALARADALAQRLAAPPPVAAPAEEAPFGLTAREVEVLRLVAEGLTDPQIAERLFVSRHTVNAHLRGVYGKLGVNTRAAAARLALENGLA